MVIKNAGDVLSAALAVLRKLGTGDPIKFLKEIDWKSITKQATDLIKEKVIALRDALNGILDSWIIRKTLSDDALASIKKNSEQLTAILPNIEKGIEQGCKEIQKRINKAINDYKGEVPHTGRSGELKKAKAKEQIPEKGNDLKGARAVTMKKHKVACFKNKKKGNNTEYDRQIAGQQNGLNNMTVQEYLDNRKYFGEIKRKGTGEAQKQARTDFKNKLIKKYKKELRLKGIKDKAQITSQAEAIANKDLKTLNALHNPDMIAGGFDGLDSNGNKITLDMGDASVNKSIGSQWNTKGDANLSRVKLMDIEAKKALEELGPNAKMNVNLHRCK